MKMEINSKVKNPRDVYMRCMMLDCDEKREHLSVLGLDKDMHLLYNDLINLGGYNYVKVDIKSVFRKAIITDAFFIIVVHNHPNGKSTPSKADEAMFIRLKKAGLILGVHVLDQVIIGSNCYYSYAKENSYKVI